MKSVSANGWPTKVIDGTNDEDFEMVVETRDCQMVAFWESIGEGDIKPYCTFFDFSAIDSGICKYCFYKSGQVQWPEAVHNILVSKN